MESAARPTTIVELQAMAEAKMAPDQRYFVARGVGENWTRDRNRAKLDEIALNPPVLVDTTDRDLSTTALGQRIEFPIMCAPAGGQTGSHREGELAVARAAGAEGILMALPTGSAHTFDEVAAAATGPLWFQHIHYSDGLTEEYLPLLKPAGFSALVLTVDVVGPFPMADALLTTPSIPSKIKSFANLRQRPDLTDDGGFAQWEPPNITWDRLDWLRELSGGLPLVLKGVRRTDDARRCLDYGVDGVIVSTHGGRQFDGGLSSIELLPQFVDILGDDAEVFFDSGIRSGLDVFRAMALGARAVFVGRPVHWGLAYDGENGVRLMLSILRAEFDKIMAYSGCSSVDQITDDLVVHTAR
ncbi:MAG: alpha-hydroxy-acid oxidizing protein [Dehalococcoidia bacterium]|nr:alpha-hydroxy-acid oxidizing protein [Dehalococcoidia bacterium]